MLYNDGYGYPPEMRQVRNAQAPTQRRNDRPLVRRHLPGMLGCRTPTPPLTEWRKILFRSETFPHLNKTAARQANRNRQTRKADAVCEHGAGCFDNAAKTMPRICAQCGATDDIQADHRISIANGGPDCRLNLQPLCKPCNQRKGIAQ